METNKGFAPLILILIIVGVLVIGGISYYSINDKDDIKIKNLVSRCLFNNKEVSAKLKDSVTLCPGQTVVLTDAPIKIFYEKVTEMSYGDNHPSMIASYKITENNNVYNAKTSHYSVPFSPVFTNEDNSAVFIVNDDFADCKLNGDKCWESLAEYRQEDSICEYAQSRKNCYDILVSKSHNGEKDYLCEKMSLTNEYCTHKKILTKILQNMKPDECINFTKNELQQCFALLAKKSGLLSKYCESISDINIKKSCTDSIHVFSDAEIRAY